MRRPVEERLEQLAASMKDDDLEYYIEAHRKVLAEYETSVKAERKILVALENERATRKAVHSSE